MTMMGEPWNGFGAIAGAGQIVQVDVTVAGDHESNGYQGASQKEFSPFRGLFVLHLLAIVSAAEKIFPQSGSDRARNSVM